MPAAASVARRFTAVAPWIGVPFLAYLALLRHFWFDAPAWDDYDAILHTIFVLQDASSWREWLGLLVNQHNEHRIAFARLVAWAMETLAGHVDFRALALVANLAWPGLLLLMWLEFRDRVPAMLFAGAALLMLQVSYYEASLVSMAGLSNIGAVFFGFACLFFANRGGGVGAVACIAFGILATGSQASGLFALPIAAAACVLQGRRLRAAPIALVALALWVAYFTGYVRPAHHPSLTAGLARPLDLGALFLLNMGSIVPGRWSPILAGIAVLALLAWLLRRGLWKQSPVTVSWIAFLVVTIAAATVGRAGFGVVHASRYAIYGTCLLVLGFLVAAAFAGPWTRRGAWHAIAACAIASVAITAMSWTAASEFAARGRLLVKAVPASPDVHADAYFGVLYPNRQRAEQLLMEAGKRRVWRTRDLTFPLTSVRIAAQAPANVPVAGYVDRATLDDRRLRLVGWSHIPAISPGRTLVLAQAGQPLRSTVMLTDRIDVATSTHVPLLAYSGFVLDLEYASAEEARRAAGTFCLFAEASRQDLARMSGSAGCGA